MASKWFGIHPVHHYLSHAYPHKLPTPYQHSDLNYVAGHVAYFHIVGGCRQVSSSESHIDQHLLAQANSAVKGQARQRWQSSSRQFGAL